jgi:hypothetical protein
MADDSPEWLLSRESATICGTQSTLLYTSVEGIATLHKIIVSIEIMDKHSRLARVLTQRDLYTTK